MRTITLVTNNRPAYTARVLGALIRCQRIWQHFDKLLISCEPGCEEVYDLCCAAAEDISNNGILETHVYLNSAKYGVAGNPLIALTRAFEEHESDFNLALEDDACLTVDASDLASWFFEHHGTHESPYFLLSMCNHNEFTGVNNWTLQKSEEWLAESTYITSPFAWCLAKHNWPIVKAHWDQKRLPPNGWDYSLSMAMHLLGLRGLHPTVSRCQNIGRVGGVHETPETFDATQLELQYSTGAHYGRYEIVQTKSMEEIRRTPPWLALERQILPYASRDL